MSVLIINMFAVQDSLIGIPGFLRPFGLFQTVSYFFH